MATKAVVEKEEAITPDEVPSSKIAEAEEEGLSNGLGLELLVPAPKKAAAAKPVVDEDEEEPDPKPDAKAADKKETPAKDPKTGRFLKKAAVSEPALEEPNEADDSVTLKKRLKDTRDYATKVNKTNQELTTRLSKLTADFEVFKAKAEGTYVEPKENTIDPVELARLTERTKISKAIAENLYGAETVEELIYAEGSPYRALEQADPYVKARVFAADQPVIEAIRQLKWKNFTDLYGDDPDKVVAALRDELTAELVKTFKEKNRTKRTVDDVGGLTDVNGSGGDREEPRTKPTKLDSKTLFPNFPTGHF